MGTLNETTISALRTNIDIGILIDPIISSDRAAAPRLLDKGEIS